MTATTPGKWMDEINNRVGDFMRLETTDGINREGRLSGLRTRQLKLNGETVDIITELELNGDPTDTIGVDRIRTLDFN